MTGPKPDVRDLAGDTELDLLTLSGLLGTVVAVPGPWHEVKTAMSHVGTPGPWHEGQLAMTHEGTPAPQHEIQLASFHEGALSTFHE
jgi:hypothetical protein